MKTYLNHSQKNNNINNNMLLRKHKAKTEQKNTITRENTRLNRPARAISFGGSAGLNKLVKKTATWTVEFANSKAVAYNAFYSLIVAGILKPMAVLKQKGSEEKDKQIIATKNFLQAFIGSFLSFTIGDQIINKAVDTINDIDLKLIDGVIENADGKKEIKLIEADSKKGLELAKEILLKENKKNKNYTPTINQIYEKSKALIKDFSDNRLKHFTKNPDFIEELIGESKMVEPGKVKSFLIDKTKNMPDSLEIFKAHPSKQTVKDGYKIFWERSTEFLTAIGKAKVSSLLLPTVMAFLFAKKNLEKQMAEEAKKNTLINNSTFKMENEQFQKMLNKNNNSQISFKGGFNSCITSAVESMANSKAGSKIAHWMAGFNKPAARMGDFESIAITAYWIQNTARSKKIEPSQKLGLNVHSALVTIVSSTAAFIIDWALDFLIDKSKAKYENKLKELIETFKDKKPTTSVDSVLDTYKIKEALHRMAITDEIKKGIKNNADDSSIISNIKSSGFFEDVKLEENLIKEIKKAIKATEPFEKEIKEACADLIGANDIAKKLATIDYSEKAITKTIDSLVGKYGKKLSKFKSMTIFTLVVRFLVPVLMVPYSGKLKKKVANWQKEREAQKAQSTK